MKKILAITIVCLLIISFSGCDYAKKKVMQNLIGPARFFDMASIKDPSSLETNIIRDENIDSRVRKNKRVRVIELTFVSQSWHESVWKHPARIYIPADYKADGNVGIIGTYRDFFDKDADYSRRIIPGTDLDTEAEYAEGTALDLGMPIMIFATPSESIFGLDESDLMGHCLKEMQKSQDLTWFPYIPIVTSYLRAITLLHSMPEVKAERAVLLGCSKRGYSTCISTGVDPGRIAGIMATCYYGGNVLYEIATKFASFGPGVRGPAQERMGPGFQPADKVLEMINSPAGYLVNMAFDPYIWRNRITTPYFVALGTNDEFYSLGAPNGMMEKLQGDTAFLYIDNVPHTWVSQKHLAAWRMWLAHVFYERELPKIRVSTESEQSSLVVNAYVKAPSPIKGVRLFYSYNGSNDWRFAEWNSSPMKIIEEGSYTAGLALDEENNLAYYVEVEDHGKGGTGYTSSLVDIIRR